MAHRIEGTLNKNEIGRWEINDHEFTSGSCLEILLDNKWIRGVIEYWHSRSDYYFYTRLEGIPIGLLQGVTARVTLNY